MLTCTAKAPLRVSHVDTQSTLTLPPPPPPHTPRLCSQSTQFNSIPSSLEASSLFAPQVKKNVLLAILQTDGLDFQKITHFHYSCPRTSRDLSVQPTENVHVHPDVCSLNTLVGLDERGSQAKPRRTIDISPIRRRCYGGRP